MEKFERTERLIGKDNLEKLQSSKVAVFGIGGVGSYVVEALARAGVGELLLVDNDVVSKSNINRQLIALNSTLNLPKVEVAKKRVFDINPDIVVDTKQIFFDETNTNVFDFKKYDYIVDAIDSVSSKILLIKTAKELGIKIISCMGTGNKLDPTKFEITDIYKTQYCPLAKSVRHRLKQEGIKNLKVVYSKELPNNFDNIPNRTPASISFVPSVAGLIIAGEVVKDIINNGKV